MSRHRGNRGIAGGVLLASATASPGAVPGHPQARDWERKSNVMRRLFLMTVVAGLTIGGAAGPALASTHNHGRSSNASAFAVWRTKVKLKPGQTEITTWFVQLYESNSRIVAQVGQDVVKCKRVSGHARCRPVSFSFGYGRPTASQVSLDRKHLLSAHLDASFRLRTFVRGKPLSHSTVTVVADWTGTGRIIRSGGVDSYRSGCVHFHDVFHAKNRKATATGTFGKTALGSSTHSFLSTSTDSFIEHRC